MKISHFPPSQPMACSASWTYAPARSLANPVSNNDPPSTTTPRICTRLPSIQPDLPLKYLQAVVQHRKILSRPTQQPYPLSHAIQRVLPKTIGKPQTLGSGTKDIQRDRNRSSCGNGCVCSDGVFRLAHPSLRAAFLFFAAKQSRELPQDCFFGKNTLLAMTR